MSRVEADDIEIPVIEIEPGWDATSMESIEECEDASIKVNAIIAEIEFQIDMFDATPERDRDYEWLARAKRALKYKKIAAQCVNNCRGRIARQAKADASNQWEVRMARVEAKLGILQ